MRGLRVAVFSALMMLGAMNVSAATEAVGVVDYQKLGQSISFQDFFKSRMEAVSGTSRQDIETLTKAMQEKRTQLEDKEAKLTDAQKKELTATVDEQKKKLSEMQSAAQKKMMEVRTSVGDELKQKLEQTMAQVALKHNLSMVLVKASVAYAVNKVDVTDEVVAELAKALGVKVIPVDQQGAANPMKNRAMPSHSGLNH